MDSWPARTFRGRRLDRNPLRRPSDRAETVATIALAAAFAVAAPLAVYGTAAGTYCLAEQSRATASLLLVISFLLAATAVGRAFVRGRLATWDAEWALVEPRWSRQRW